MEQIGVQNLELKRKITKLFNAWIEYTAAMPSSHEEEITISSLLSG